ncbi:hypothetical protein KQH51_02040 [bacterium]|nr:hypothetical protein [bacterium]MCB2201705.1 hypothetical protein [bacterium]
MTLVKKSRIFELCSWNVVEEADGMLADVTSQIPELKEKLDKLARYL